MAVGEPSRLRRSPGERERSSFDSSVTLPELPEEDGFVEAAGRSRLDEAERLVPDADFAGLRAGVGAELTGGACGIGSSSRLADPKRTLAAEAARDPMRLPLAPEGFASTFSESTVPKLEDSFGESEVSLTS